VLRVSLLPGVEGLTCDADAARAASHEARHVTHDAVRLRARDAEFRLDFWDGEQAGVHDPATAAQHTTKASDTIAMRTHAAATPSREVRGR
jgi:hypothetical protein